MQILNRVRSRATPFNGPQRLCSLIIGFGRRKGLRRWAVSVRLARLSVVALLSGRPFHVRQQRRIQARLPPSAAALEEFDDVWIKAQRHGHPAIVCPGARLVRGWLSRGE